MRAMVRGGLRIFANIEYHSNIMGEHSYFRVRIGDKDRHSILDRVNLIVALDEETLLGEPHVKFTGHGGPRAELGTGALGVYHSAVKTPSSQLRHRRRPP